MNAPVLIGQPVSHAKSRAIGLSAADRHKEEWIGKYVQYDRTEWLTGSE